MASKGFIRSFLSSVMGTGLSRVMGAARDIVVGAVLGAGDVSDAFFIAFTIPNTFRRFVADEGLTGALVPAISQAEEEEGPEAARQLANATFTALLLANLVLCLLGIWGAEWVVKAFAYAFTDDPELFALTVKMTRWLFPFLAMVSVVSFAEGLLNYKGHFFWPKVAPGLVSAGIVTGLLLAVGWFSQPVYAAVAGVLVGGLAHVLVVVPPLVTRWGWVSLRFAFQSERLRRLLSELGKVVVIGVFAQVNILVLRQVAAALGEGSVTHYRYANRVVDLAQGVIAVAIGSVLLPMVSQAVAAKDWDRFRNDLARALRLTAFMLFPATAVIVGFGLPTTAMLFRLGNFTMLDVQSTASTLMMLTPFMLSVAGINIVKKAFFALDARNPLLMVGGAGVMVTGALGYALVSDYGLPGLAIALSVSTCGQLAAYLVILRRRLGESLGLGALVLPLIKTALAAAPVALLLWGAAQLGQWELGPRSALNVAVYLSGGAAAVALYLGLAWVLKLQELRTVVGQVRRRLGRSS